jgi:hypothetical protein
MKNPASVVRALQAAGWRIYLNGKVTAPDGVPWDFYPWDDGDLIPVSEAGSDALRRALAGELVPERGRCGRR